MMSRNAAAVLIFLATLVVQMVVIVFVAVEWVPDFYGQTLRVSHQQNAAMGAALIKVIALFQQQIAVDGEWKLKLSDAQINGWLATELPKQRPPIMPDTMQDPRIAILPKQCRVACQYHDMGSRAVLQMSVTAIPEPAPNQIRLRVLEAAIGSVPGLEHQAIAPIRYAAWKAGIRLQWQEDLEQNPELIASLPPQWLGPQRAIFVDAIEFGQGEVVVRGRAETIPASASRAKPRAKQDVARQPGTDMP